MVMELSWDVVVGRARFAAYLSEAGGDVELAGELYQWGVRLAGAWHSHLSYVEVIVRNAMDARLRQWNAEQVLAGRQLTWEWTASGGTAPTLHVLMSRGVDKAREEATREADRRARTHPRHRAQVTHDDIVAQLTFGAWSRLVRAPGRARHEPHQQQLWQECLCQAFPYADPGEQGRRRLGDLLEGLRVLRNRVAHHDNLLGVNTPARLGGSLAVLAMIDPSYPDLVMAQNTLRRLDKERPTA